MTNRAIIVTASGLPPSDKVSNPPCLSCMTGDFLFVMKKAKRFRSAIVPLGLRCVLGMAGHSAVS